MMKHEWSLLCEKVIIDQNTNSLSIIGCVEQITTTVLPASLPGLTLAATWRQEPVSQKESSLNLKLIIKDPNREEELIFETEEITTSKERQRLALQIPYIFKSQGYYTFILQEKNKKKGWETVNEIPIQIIYKPN